ncbi:hypothetical protein XH83_13245 [Bradyrhizobium sp. CCBAU 53351]|uniref:hypothetical protein n=1 Tax=Bradyrhizobium sp. CCBAU 53351 TaxID=1325114 RepID=UPI001887C603|nr:hypothetical protein [Bradyrhizobium sp. CCBAU 53351]QOZ76327.1 hypothetical protein XH83_13245 [Bradyrhizobium sp. CCBAU 53351]
MKSAPAGLSALTDIAANLFALLLLVLILLLGARPGSPGSPATALSPIDVENDLVSVDRTPLGSEDLFDLLYERRQDSDSIRIDLLNQGIVVTSQGRTARLGLADDVTPRLARLIAPRKVSIGLYVFSPRFYRAVLAALEASGASWREMSVPQALKSSSVTSDHGWSDDFMGLVSRPSDRARFRHGLARLLQSGGDEAAARAFKAAGDQMQPSSTGDRIARWSRAALNAIVILGGLIFIIWVEFCRRRALSAATT